MSTVKTGNLQSLTSGEAPVIKDSSGTEVGQVCKAWVNFDWETAGAPIRDSFNVSSVTDDGVGYFTINFTNNMSNINYAMSGSGGNKNTAAATNTACNVNIRCLTTYASMNVAYLKISTTYNDSASYDYYNTCVMIFSN